MFHGPIKVAFGALALAAAVSMSHAADGLIVKKSSQDVPTTVDRIVSLIDKGPAKVMARIDHQANAKTVDKKLGAATVIIFGNPNVGTQLMQENPRAAFDLPVRILVWDDDGQTRVGYLDPAMMKRRYELTGDAANESLTKMTKVLDGLTTKATAAK